MMRSFQWIQWIIHIIHLDSNDGSIGIMYNMIRKHIITWNYVWIIHIKKNTYYD